MSVHLPTAEMVELTKKTKIIDDLLGGTATMRKAAQTYLFQMEMEEPDSYRKRLECSTLYPALSETLSQMTGRVFFNPIDVADVTETVQALFDDVDLVGNNLDVFASRWFYSALAYGCSFALIDFTRVEAVKSRAEEKALNARPYWVHIKPHQVLGIKTARVNGKQAITQFRYVVNEQVEDGEFGVKTVKHVYVYEIGKVRKFSEAEGEFRFESELQLTAQNRPLDFVPVVPFITKRNELTNAIEPPLMELAYLNVKHWQSQSDQDNITNIARVPLLAIYSNDEVKQLAIGGSAVHLPTGSSMQFVEHSGQAIASGVESLKDLEEQMKTAGAKLLTKTALAMTDSQARDEAGKEISQLRLLANRFEDAIDLALEYTGHWLGIAKEQVGNVQISGNIENDLDPSASMASVIQLRNAGVISNQSTFDEAKRRGLLADGLEWDTEQERLQSEGMHFDLEETSETNA
nr:MAG TPA: portal [Caudoviricetes sp.]